MSEVQEIYREYNYVINGKNVVIKRRWTKRIKEPERVRDMRAWITKNYDRTKNITENYQLYIEDIKNKQFKKPTMTTFTKYYRQELPTPSAKSATSTPSAKSATGNNL